MTQSPVSKAEAAQERSEETRSFVRRVKAATRRRYAPEEKIRIVLEGFRREVTVSDLCLHALGLIPSWAKSASVGSRMINARAETVAERPSFRTALQRRRCLVLTDGFYEWERKGSSRRPMRIVMASGSPSCQWRGQNVPLGRRNGGPPLR